MPAIPNSKFVVHRRPSNKSVSAAIDIVTSRLPEDDPKAIEFRKWLIVKKQEAEHKAAEEEAKRLHVGDAVTFQLADKNVTGIVQRLMTHSVIVAIDMISYNVAKALCTKVPSGSPAIVPQKPKHDPIKHYDYVCESCGLGLDEFDKCPWCGGAPAFA